MTNDELAGLLEEAARRLRGGFSIGPSGVKTRLSIEEYATLKELHKVTVRNQCRSGKIVARKVSKSWEIDLERTEILHSAKYGNTTERALRSSNSRMRNR